MSLKIKISLQMPRSDPDDKYFSFYIKRKLTNENAVFSGRSSVFIISDIEGNFREFCELLIQNEIIDRHFRWTFDNNHLVIAGDCFDRGEEVMECLWLIYSLEEKAMRVGGHVHFILGNHEIMNMNGDWRYVHPKYALKTKSGRGLVALYDGNNELWRWLCTKNIVEKIGDMLIVHGGMAKELVEFGHTVTEINRLVRPFYTFSNMTTDNPFLSVIFNSSNSPFWYRGYYDGTATEEQIDAVLAHFDVKTIITGHTQVKQVSSYFNGKVINVNTDHAAGISEGLLVSDNKCYRVNQKGVKELLK